VSGLTGITSGSGSQGGDQNFDAIQNWITTQFNFLLSTACPCFEGGNNSTQAANTTQSAQPAAAAAGAQNTTAPIANATAPAQ